MNVKQKFLGAAAATILLGATAQPANAAIVEDGWRLNLSTVGGNAWDTGVGNIAAMGDTTNIDNLALVNGLSTVFQTLVGGSPVGQSFTDTGTVGVGTVYQVEGGGNAFVSSALVFYDLFFAFDLTGTYNADNTITFNSCAACINLYLANDLDQDTSTGFSELLAVFDLVDPSGGSDLDFFGGANPNATIDITLQENSSAYASLFADSANNPFPFLSTLHLGNLNALVDPNYNPNPLFSGPGPCDPALGGVGCTLAELHTENAGQYNIQSVPEPSTLALLGAGLLGLGFVVRRRKRVTQA